MAHGRLGDFERSLHWTDEAFRLGQESGDPDAQLDAELARAIVESLRGNPDVAIEYATRAAETADRVDNKACAIVARTLIGEQRLRLGDAPSAIQVLEETVGLAEYCQLVPVKVEQAELLLASAKGAERIGRVRVRALRAGAGTGPAAGRPLRAGRATRAACPGPHRQRESSSRAPGPRGGGGNPGATRGRAGSEPDTSLGS